jgi:hypothetical protein
LRTLRRVRRHPYLLAANKKRVCHMASGVG